MYYHISELERRTEGWLCSAYYVAVYYYWDNSLVLVVAVCTAVAFITHLQYVGNCSFSGDVHSFVV